MLARDERGNVTILTALAMPLLIGGAGLGVDITQWYLWKRELQGAVDQAALAGAYARAETTSEGYFEERAEQVFSEALAFTAGDASAPTVELVSYAGGSANSVRVTASTSRPLPFSGFFLDSAPTITATAQAAFQIVEPAPQPEDCEALYGVEYIECVERRGY